jgi:hypothetical protein
MNKQLPPHYVYWFIVGSCLFVLCYIVAITFIPIPKENVRFVDISLAFLMGTVLGGGMSYYVGASSDRKEKESDGTEK